MTELSQTAKDVLVKLAIGLSMAENEAMLSSESPKDADAIIDSIQRLLAVFLGIPEDKNPSERMDYGGEDDYCRDWYYEQIRDIAEDGDMNNWERRAGKFIDDALTQSEFLTPEEDEIRDEAIGVDDRVILS